jgi:hypothetical protein
MTALDIYGLTFIPLGFPSISYYTTFSHFNPPFIVSRGLYFPSSVDRVIGFASFSGLTQSLSKLHWRRKLGCRHQKKIRQFVLSFSFSLKQIWSFSTLQKSSHPPRSFFFLTLSFVLRCDIYSSFADTLAIQLLLVLHTSLLLYH